MDNDELMLKVATTLADNVYQDGLSPAVKNLGKALGDISSAIQLVTLPFAFLGDTVSVIKEKYRDFLNKTYAKVPDEKQSAPDKTILYEVIKNVLPSFDKEDICEMYSNLLASASTKDKQSCIHPSFPFLISQLGSVEVLLLKEINESPRKSLPYIEVFGFVEYSAVPIQLVEPVAVIKGYKDDYKRITAAIQTLLRLQILRKQPRSRCDTNKEYYHFNMGESTFKAIHQVLDSFADESGKIESTKISEGALVPTILGIDFIHTCSNDA